MSNILAKFKNLKFGFTLAEVLITMGVIGVVAVLTLGHFVQNYNEKKYINRFFIFIVRKNIVSSRLE